MKLRTCPRAGVGAGAGPRARQTRQALHRGPGPGPSSGGPIGADLFAPIFSIRRSSPTQCRRRRCEAPHSVARASTRSRPQVTARPQVTVRPQVTARRPAGPYGAQPVQRRGLGPGGLCTGRLGPAARSPESFGPGLHRHAGFTPRSRGTSPGHGPAGYAGLKNRPWNRAQRVELDSVGEMDPTVWAGFDVENEGLTPREGGREEEGGREGGREGGTTM